MRHLAALRVVPLLMALVSFAADGGAQQPDLSPHVVGIYDQDGDLLGTGTAISFSGLILTAKRVLEDRSDQGARPLTYLHRVFTEQSQGTAGEPADLLVVHPFLDLAVLARRGGLLVPPLPVGVLSELDDLDSLTVVGLRRGDGGQPRSVTLPVRSRIQEMGNLDLSGVVDSGMIGGPAVAQGRVVGVVRASGAGRTTVVPFEKARDYLDLMGIAISPEGLAFETEKISLLASKAALYEELLLKLQTDVNWFAEIEPLHAGAASNSFADDFVLRVGYTKKLAIQPSFETLVSLRLVPVFAGPAPTIRDTESEGFFSLSDWLARDAVRGRVSQFGAGHETRHRSNLWRARPAHAPPPGV